MKYWIYAFMLVAQTAVAQVTPGEGNDGPHGGFAYREVSDLVRQATEELTDDLLQLIPDDFFIRHHVDRRVVEDAVRTENVREGFLLTNSRLDLRTRLRRPLELDYSFRRGVCRVTFLAPFYERISHTVHFEHPEFLKNEIQELLFHESAHCSGLGETAARTFAVEAAREISAWWRLTRSTPRRTLIVLWDDVDRLWETPRHVLSMHRDSVSRRGLIFGMGGREVRTECRGNLCRVPETGALYVFRTDNEQRVSAVRTPENLEFNRY